MKKSKNFLAIDFGASNGRVMVGAFNGELLSLNEVHRFENQPVYMGDTFYWDFPRLFHELKNGLMEAAKKFASIDSLGVETWGCDFGLLDKNKLMLSTPVHYRDKRTIGLSQKVKKIFSDWDMYQRTQAQISEINTLYQLYSLKEKRSTLIDNARYFLLMGDLFNFYLTREIICEFTNATLTQLLNQREKKWERSLIDKLGLPFNIFNQVMEPGQFIGKLSDDLSRELNCGKIPVVLPAYDTTSEITAIPVSSGNNSKNWAYLNCGTWAMVGIISNEPVVTKEGFEKGFGNEGGFGGKYHFLKNMVGLWIIQQCRKKWIEEQSHSISWKDIDKYTGEAVSRNIFIDVDDPVFEREVFDMPSVVCNYCRETQQDIPSGIGEISLVFYESLAMKYLYNLKNLEKITGRKMELLHMVGGGTGNQALCQWISDAAGLPLVAGPRETTTAGNLLAQMAAAGAVANINEAREILVNSVSLNTYEPDDKKKDYWQQKFGLYLNKLGLATL